MSTEHCPELKMLPIQQGSLSSTFPKLLTQPPSPDPPHLTHFLTDNWCQPRGCAVPWPPGTKRDPGTCRPNPPPTNRSVVQFTTTIQTPLRQERCLRCSKLASQQDSIFGSIFGNMIGSDEKYNLSPSRASDDNTTYAN